TAFRGVLQAALGRVMPGRAAIAVTSGIFGIWHVGPTAGALRINGLAGRGRILAGVTAGGPGGAGGGRGPAAAGGRLGGPGRARAASYRHELRRRADGLGRRADGPAGWPGEPRLTGRWP